MTDGQLAVLIFAVYAALTQWAFRCQRVGRGILLLAKDTAAGQHRLFSQIMPTRYVSAIWIGRLLWIGAAFFAWRASSWYGLVAVLAYGFIFGAWIDTISPWPSYPALLKLFKRRLQSGKAGVEALFLLPTVRQIEEEMSAGTHFEKITTGTWLSRAEEAAQTLNEKEEPAPMESGANGTPT